MNWHLIDDLTFVLLPIRTSASQYIFSAGNTFSNKTDPIPFYWRIKPHTNINLTQNENNLRYNTSISRRNRPTSTPPTIHHFPPTKSHPFFRRSGGERSCLPPTALTTPDKKIHAAAKKLKAYITKSQSAIRTSEAVLFPSLPGGIIERCTAPVVAELTLPQTAKVRHRCWQRLKNCHARVSVLIFDLRASFEVGNYKINGRFWVCVLLEFSFD